MAVLATLKGWRTVGYEILSTVSIGLAVVVATDLGTFGWDGRTTALVGLGLKVADSVVGLWLRWMTDSPIGKAE